MTSISPRSDSCLFVIVMVSENVSPSSVISQVCEDFSNELSGEACRASTNAFFSGHSCAIALRWFCVLDESSPDALVRELGVE